MTVRSIAGWKPLVGNWLSTLGETHCDAWRVVKGSESFMVGLAFVCEGFFVVWVS